MTDNDSLVSARDLAVGYNGQAILRHVTFDVRAGEFWFLLGGNGEGKTTFLRTLLGLIAPQGGSLWLDPRRARRELLGFVPQRCDLNPNLPTTIREFVSLGLVGIAVSRQEAAQRLTQALEIVGLGGQAQRNYWSLSGGQRQRALVARALVRRPQLLILDEPTTGLDPASEEALLMVLASLNREQRLTLLFVTHDVGTAARYATHVALFHDGGISTGPRAAMLTPEHLERIYGMPLATHGGHSHWPSIGGHQ